MKFKVTKIAKEKIDVFKKKVEQNPTLREDWGKFKERYERGAWRWANRRGEPKIIGDMNAFITECLHETFYKFCKAKNKPTNQEINNAIMMHLMRRQEALKNKKRIKRQKKSPLADYYRDKKQISKNTTAQTKTEVEIEIDLIDKIVTEKAREAGFDPEKIQDIHSLWPESSQEEIAKEIMHYILWLSRQKFRREAEEGYDVFRLFWEEGYSRAEITRIKNTKWSTVDQHIERGEKKIRKYCKEYIDELSKPKREDLLLRLREYYGPDYGEKN